MKPSEIKPERNGVVLQTVVQKSDWETKSYNDAMIMNWLQLFKAYF
jgi:hypothetical protein